MLCRYVPVNVLYSFVDRADQMCGMPPFHCDENVNTFQNIPSDDALAKLAGMYVTYCG